MRTVFFVCLFFLNLLQVSHTSFIHYTVALIVFYVAIMVYGMAVGCTHTGYHPIITSIGGLVSLEFKALGRIGHMKLLEIKRITYHYIITITSAPDPNFFAESLIPLGWLL